MKTFLLLGILLLTSCVKYTKEGPFYQESLVIAKNHEDSRIDMTYHYGYSITRGKWCMHFGPEDIPEKNEVYFLFFNDTIVCNDIVLYDSANEVVYLKYIKIYQDSAFSHNKLINVSYKPI